jgi:F-type H+-transporting ATPase subunit gamma
MAGQLRVIRGRIRSVSATAKITRAMQLIAASRIVKAQQRVAESTPYANELTRVVSALATFSRLDHPLATEIDNPRRAAVLICSSDRGLAGAYSSSVLRESERLFTRLREAGIESLPYVVGRKGIQYLRFRQRAIEGEWTGFTDGPRIENAIEIGDALLEKFGTDTDDGGVDEIHIVYTRFKNRVSQEVEVIRLAPLEVVEGDERPGEHDVLPLYEFEPGAQEVLDALLPRYVTSRIYNCLLQAAASELAARQRAMQSATDNADDLVKKLTRTANQVRQSDITQEISEIVGGANALADAGSRD